jgi:hypothetical protein
LPDSSDADRGDEPGGEFSGFAGSFHDVVGRWRRQAYQPIATAAADSGSVPSHSTTCGDAASSGVPMISASGTPSRHRACAIEPDSDQDCARRRLDGTVLPRPLRVAAAVGRLLGVVLGFLGVLVAVIVTVGIVGEL